LEAELDIVKRAAKFLDEHPPASKGFTRCSMNLSPPGLLSKRVVVFLV
jgi:hypothetical protein